MFLVFFVRVFESRCKRGNGRSLLQQELLENSQNSENTAKNRSFSLVENFDHFLPKSVQMTKLKLTREGAGGKVQAVPNSRGSLFVSSLCILFIMFCSLLEHIIVCLLEKRWWMRPTQDRHTGVAAKMM